MNPEIERSRPEVSKQRPPSPPSKKPTEFRKEPEIKPEFETIRKSYAPEVCVVLGFAFLVVGLLGFVIPYLLDAHLSYAHNVIHVVTGALALWFGLKNESSAKKFALIFGAVYMALGLLGFVAGVRGVASIANPVEDAYLWKFIPNVLELGTSDHVIHLVAGAAFILAGIMKFTVRRRVN